jgi:hypothetical protein
MRSAGPRFSPFLPGIRKVPGQFFLASCPEWGREQND